MENTKNETNTNKVEKSSQQTAMTKKEEFSTIYNYTLQMSVTDATISYEKIENEQGYDENTDIEKGITLFYVNIEQDENGEDDVIQKTVYISFEYDMVTKRGDELLKELIGSDIELLDIKVNKEESLFPKGYKVISKTKEKYFNFNRYLEMKVVSIKDESYTPYKKRKVTQTELTSIIDGRRKPIMFINMKKSQMEKFRGKKILVEYITREYKNTSDKFPTYSTKTLPTVV